MQDMTNCRSTKSSDWPLNSPV